MKRFAIILSVLLTLLTSALSAQDPNNVMLEGVEGRRAALEEITNELAANDKPDYANLRENLRRVRDEAVLASRPLRILRDNVAADLKQLGPAPEAGQSEVRDIADLRAQLTENQRKIEQSILQADLNIAAATRLLQDVAAARRRDFYTGIFKRGASPLSPTVWAPAWISMRETQTQFLKAASTAGRERLTKGNALLAFLSMTAAFAFAVILFGPARRWIDRNLLKRVLAYQPTHPSRAVAAGLRVAARVVPGVIGGLIVVETARALGLVNETTQSFVITIWFGLLALLFVDGVSTAVFMPKLENWRLVPLESGPAARIRLYLQLAAALFFTDALLKQVSAFFGGAEELARFQGAIVATAGAILLLVLCRQSLWRIDENRRHDYSKEVVDNWNVLRRTGNFLALLVIIAAVLGYVAFSQYLITRIYFAAGVLVASWFIRVLIQEAINYFSVQAAARAKIDDAISEDSEKLFFFWIGVMVDIIIFALLMPILLIVLGVDWSEVRDWLRDAFFGFKIGSVTISIAQIASALGAFAFFMAATRFVQRGVDKRIFSKANIDDGVRNSLRTLLGYFGLVLGLVTAIAVLGVNLASLAIIAGALSVGIGFGLQSIVNNFVSGLILLFERPIKVGDWIIVSSGEGIVKRISVRSTEIETFDKASIIVPNSELISSSVTNWTHKDKYTRQIIRVGVSYKEDPDRVIEILNSVIAANRRVVRYPQPFVLFSGFGDSSLDFEIRVFIKDISDRIVVQNEIRIAAFAAFREAGIEIPFPQRDIHIRSGSQPAINSDSEA